MYDPIVFIINTQFPHLLGFADFKSFNLVPAIFVRGYAIQLEREAADRFGQLADAREFSGKAAVG